MHHEWRTFRSLNLDSCCYFPLQLHLQSVKVLHLTRYYNPHRIISGAPYPSWALSDKSSGSYLSARRADIKFCKQDYTANNGQALKPLYIIISAAILANLISLYFYFSLHRLTQITHCKLWYQLQHEWLKYISREATVSNISFTYQKASGYATDTIKTGLLWSYHSRTKPKPCLIHI